MAPRDTVIEVRDARTGYEARIVVPYDKVLKALRPERRPSGQPLADTKNARSHICIQAKAEMAKQGRPPSLWLTWEDIAHSVEVSEKVPARGTDPSRPVAQAYAIAHPPVATPEDVVGGP